MLMKSMFMALTMLFALQAYEVRAEPANAQESWISEAISRLEKAHGSSCNAALFADIAARCESHRTQLKALDPKKPEDASRAFEEAKVASTELAKLFEILKGNQGSLQQDFCGRYTAESISCISSLKLELLVVKVRLRKQAGGK